MIIKKRLFIFFCLLFTQTVFALSLEEQIKQLGYLEILNKSHGTVTFDSLYANFDQLIECLQANPVWAQKLYIAKERFIRSKNKGYYSTNFFGFYDESKKEGRNQVSFYYSPHFHEFICSEYPELNEVLEITRFLENCREIQKPYGDLFHEVATELGVETIFYSDYGRPPILFKVVKYFPNYTVTYPHYDGTAFSLFLDSTDNGSLLLSSYKSSYTINDFALPAREFSRECNQNSNLLIPGVLLTEFFIFPTPHIVMESKKIRFATIAFAMRPHFQPEKNELTPLPSFKD